MQKDLKYAIKTYQNALRAANESSRAFDDALEHLNESRQRVMTAQTELSEIQMSAAERKF